MRWKSWIGWSIILIVLLLSGSQTDVAQAQSPQNAIIAQVNQFRAAQGLPPFTYNAQLAVAAGQQAQFIGVNNRYTHTGTGGSTPQTRANAAGYSGRVTENIVGGSRMTAPQALAWWQNSAPHYATITSDYYTEIGAGFATGTLEQNIYAIVVGRPADAPTPVPDRSSGNSNSASQPVAQPAPIAAPPFNLAAPDDAGQIVHTVRQGQALWTLAAYYEVELDYIYRINNLKESDFVLPGDEIVVQLAEGVPTPTPLPTPTPPFEHTVARGQTLWSIATFHDLDMPQLLYLNSLTESSLIRPGDELIVRLRPGQSPPPTATPQMTHQITNGQTLWEIALRYGLSLEDILTFNGITETTLLQPGETLFIRQPALGVGDVEEVGDVGAVEEVAVVMPTATSTMGVAGVDVGVEEVGEDVVSAETTPTPSPTLSPTATESRTPAAVANASTPEPTTGSPTSSLPVENSTFQTTIVLASAAILSGVIGLYLVLRRPNRR